ncbi:MAG: helicase HerA-like domain-containing protein [bacterium]
MSQDFQAFFSSNYAGLKGLAMGRPELAGKIYNEQTVSIPLSVLTRHGLITGSTGTGKSRAIQLMIEALTQQEIPVFLSDIKGDHCCPLKVL